MVERTARRGRARPRGRLAVAAAGACCAVTVRAAAPAQAETFRIATLAPKNSSWGKVFKVWQKVVEKKTDGKLKLRIYYNAVQGDEHAMVSKMKTGQLDGASLAAGGLSLIHRDVLILQLPGVVNSWPLLDMVRGIVGTRIEAGFEKKGFKILDWGDIGLVRTMSKGFAVRGPRDLRGKRPAVFRNEPIGPMMFSLIGGVVSVPVSVPEILPQLRSGAINVLSAPALATEQLQWGPQLDHMGSPVVVTAIGATVVRKKKLDALPADVRTMFWKLQKKAQKVNRGRIRRLDAEAYRRLARKMKLVRPTENDKFEWYKIWLKSVHRMRNGIFPRDLIDTVLEATGKG